MVLDKILFRVLHKLIILKSPKALGSPTFGTKERKVELTSLDISFKAWAS